MNKHEPLTVSAVKALYDAMCAKGTSAYSPNAWRTAARMLHDAARSAPEMFRQSLRDRAKDCSSRAVRSAYVGCVGAGFRSEVAS